MEAIREIKKLRGHRVTLNLPERFSNLEVEVIVFPLKSQKVKTNGHTEVLNISESALKKDWNLPREDKAWQSL